MLLAHVLGGIKHGDSWTWKWRWWKVQEKAVFRTYSSSPYAVLSKYTIGNRMSLGDAFLNRQIFFGRASVSTFLYYNIYGTVSTFSRSPCGWEVLLSVVPFAVLPWHSLGCLQYLCIQEESRPSILFIFASTYASTVSPRTPDTLLNAMARMVTTTHLPVSLQER
jgi:hypothetical protein